MLYLEQEQAAQVVEHFSLAAGTLAAIASAMGDKKAMKIYRKSIGGKSKGSSIVGDTSEMAKLRNKLASAGVVNKGEVVSPSHAG